MKLKFNVTFKNGLKTVATVEGVKEVDTKDVTVNDLGEAVHQVEQHLEKLTGLRVHVEQVS